MNSIYLKIFLSAHFVSGSVGTVGRRMKQTKQYKHVPSWGYDLNIRRETINNNKLAGKYFIK
jgi:hypothetical protein